MNKSILMMPVLDIKEIKRSFPDEWVLLGNPVMDESKIDVIAGIPILHSKDKKEVCYIGREKTADFETIALIFTGDSKPARKMTGIFNRISQ